MCSHGGIQVMFSHEMGLPGKRNTQTEKAMSKSVEKVRKMRRT